MAHCLGQGIFPWGIAGLVVICVHGQKGLFCDIWATILQTAQTAWMSVMPPRSTTSAWGFAGPAAQENLGDSGEASASLK